MILTSKELGIKSRRFMGWLMLIFATTALVALSTTEDYTLSWAKCSRLFILAVMMIAGLILTKRRQEHDKY